MANKTETRATLEAAKRRRNLPPGCIRLKDYDTITNVAKVAQVPRETMRDAVARRDKPLIVVTTRGGLVLVKVSSAYRWAKAKEDRRAGRPTLIEASGLFD